MAIQPTYPHDIEKRYVWFTERGKIAICYHDMDDGNNGRNGEFISPIVGYDAKVVSSSIVFVDGGGGADTIVDTTNSNFLTAGFAATQTITVSGASNSGNNASFTIVSVTADTITVATGSLTAETSATLDKTIIVGDATKVRMHVVKRAEVIDKVALETESSGQFLTSNLNDEPEYQEQFHEAIVFYVIARGFEMAPSKEALEISRFWLMKYYEMVKKAKAFAENNRIYGLRQVSVHPTAGIL